MIVASYCGTSCGVPLFLHVFGAMLLVGSVATVVLLAAVGLRNPLPMLNRVTFLSLLATVLPSWLAMRAGGQWLVSHEHLEHLNAAWLGIGFAVGDAGLVVLLITTGFAYWATRRPPGGWQARAVAVLSALYLVALAVAWFAMSGKP